MFYTGCESLWHRVLFSEILINNWEQVAPHERLVRPESAKAPLSFLKGKHLATIQVSDGADNSQSGVELGPRRQ